LAAAFSPLALVFSATVLLASLIGVAWPLRTIGRHRLAVGAAAGVLVAAGLLQRAFPSGGSYPYGVSDLATIAVFCAVGFYLAGNGPSTRSLRALFVVYMALNLLAFAVSSPLGANATRLFAFAGLPLAWLAANVGRRRPHIIVLPLLVLVSGLQAASYANTAYTDWGDPAARLSYWQPALRFLGERWQGQTRVEVVATAGHWEAYFLPREGIPLARGWFRQDDFPNNTPLYQDHISAARYQAWLRSVGVRYVLLPDAPLDYSSSGEAHLLRSGRSGLTILQRTGHWTIYQLPDPGSIISPPPGQTATVRRITESSLTFWTSGPGRYLVRVRYSPYWTSPADETCIRPATNQMTRISAAFGGTITLQINPTITTIANAITATSAQPCSTD